MSKSKKRYQGNQKEELSFLKPLPTNGSSVRTYTPVVKLPELELANKPTVIISKEVQSQINYYHHKTKSIEWSGFLLFEQEGDLSEIDKIVLICKYIHLLDIGSSGFTEIKDYDPFEVVDDIGDIALSYKMGIIHTHHSMNTFFSGTDTDCLHENASNFPFLLSLIVNFDVQYCAKIAFIGKDSARKRELTLNSRLGDIKLSLGDKKEEDILIICDCKIILEQEAYVTKRYDTLVQTKEAERKKISEKWSQGYPNYLDTKVTPFNQREREFDWRKGWDIPTTGYKEPSKITIKDITAIELDDYMIKIVSADLTAYDQSLFYCLKRIQTVLGGKDEEQGFYLDLVEDNFEKLSNAYFMRELDFDELSLLAHKMCTKLTAYKEIEISKELQEIFELYDNEASSILQD